MKNRIIALILVCVMSVIAFASCDANKFNFAENSDEYAKVDLDGLMKAIAAIEIEDADFTTNEDTRAQKVIYNIIGDLTSAALKNNSKLTEGKLNEDDVLYFSYYCTYTDDDGKTYEFYRDQMTSASVTSSTTSANHVVELGTVLNNEDAKLGRAVYDALIKHLGTAVGEDGKFELAIDGLTYASTSTTGTVVETGNTVVISYTRTEDLGEEDTAKVEKLAYMELVLDKDKYAQGSEADQLVELILGENVTAKVGSDISKTVTDENGDEKTEKTFELTVDGKKYTYSEIGIEWRVDEAPAAPLFSFEYTPDNVSELEDNKLHEKDKKVDVKGKALTYHIYPVSYIEVSEISESSIIKEIFGSSITTSSIELFESEEYKNGEDTLKSLVETLEKIWDSDAELFKTLEDADGNTLEKLSNDVTTADEELEGVESTNIKYEELKKAYDDAVEAYDNAVEYCKDQQIEKILAASNGEKTVGDIFLEEYKKDIYETLKSNYDDAIYEAVGQELWLLIDEYVTVDSYPEEMVEEFYEHIYEQHEYNFYNGKYSTSSSTTTSTESNYSHYKGDLEAYLVAVTEATNGDYETAITEEAKSQLKPLLQIFALSAAIEADSSINITEVMKSYTEADKDAGAYEVYSHEGHDHDEGDTEEEEESLQKQYENALADAEHFLVDDAALKAYKKYIGKASYDAYIDQYGETNLRAALQLNRLMYYFLSTNVTYDDEGVSSYNYKTVDGVVVLDFRTVNYVFAAEDDADNTEDAE